MKLFRFCKKKHIYKSGEMSFRIVKDKSMDKYCIEYTSKYENGIWIRLASRADANLRTVYQDLLKWIDYYKDKRLEFF